MCEEKKIKQQILSALNNEMWDYRTVEGIAQETGLDKKFVRDYLNSASHLVRKLPIPDRLGREMYSLRSRRTWGGELVRLLAMFVSKRVV